MSYFDTSRKKLDQLLIEIQEDTEFEQADEIMEFYAYAARRLGLLALAISDQVRSLCVAEQLPQLKDSIEQVITRAYKKAEDEYNNLP